MVFLPKKVVILMQGLRCVQVALRENRRKNNRFYQKNFVIYNNDLRISSRDSTKEITSQNNSNIITDITLYPNPANQTITISFSEAQESVKQVRIINMQGKVVLSQENPSNNTVNIANLPVGMYVVRVLSQSGKEYAVKLVKE
ncbi:MAG: hypothetical protein CW341_11410 [Bacteroidetes bacterium]|nr:hypothetical protein [Bacteroidota bacterium]